MYEYKPGRSTVTKKWKWPQLNTVDFLVRVTTDRRPNRANNKIFKLFLWGPNNQYMEYRQVFFQNKCVARLLADLGESMEAIIECSYSNKFGEWQYHRLRPDKPHANYATVALQGLEARCDNIDAECLKKGLLGSRQVPVSHAPRARSTGQAQGQVQGGSTATDSQTTSTLTPDSALRTTPEGLFSIPTPVDIRSTEDCTSPEYTDVIYDSPLEKQIQTPILPIPEISEMPEIYDMPDIQPNFKRNLEEPQKTENPPAKRRRTNTKL